MCRKAKKTCRTQNHSNEVWLCAQHVVENKKYTANHKKTPMWVSFMVGIFVACRKGHMKHAKHKNTHLLVCFCVVICQLWPEAKSWAKPGQKKPGLIFGL